MKTTTTAINVSYELTFWGAGIVRAYKFPWYRRMHRTMESAQAAATKVYRALDRIGVTAAHPAIVYGPECGRDGKRV